MRRKCKASWTFAVGSWIVGGWALRELADWWIIGLVERLLVTGFWFVVGVYPLGWFVSGIVLERGSG
jgi:hypothetical protein